MSGPGLHTGEKCTVRLFPAPPGTGRVFVTSNGEIRAIVENVSDTRRETSLRNGSAEVHTVEHILAALYGLGVDNARIEVEGPEMPAGDGSALPFVEMIDRAEIIGQGVQADEIFIENPVWINNADKCMLATVADKFSIRSLITFAHPMIGEQAACFDISAETFRREIAPARTFCTSDEIEAILAQGLGKGGNEENVIVAYADRYSSPLRFSDEFVRHKILDVIGDLSLIGGRLRADITAIRSSHTLNIALAKKIAKEATREQGGR